MQPDDLDIVRPFWHLEKGDGPLLGIAVHAGHDMRPELVPYLAIDEQTRLREEDPYADYWTLACGRRMLPQRSRFEVDLNRPRNEPCRKTAGGLKSGTGHCLIRSWNILLANTTRFTRHWKSS